MCSDHEPAPADTTAADTPATPPPARGRIARRALLTTGVLGAASLLVLRSRPGTAAADNETIIGPTQLLTTNRSDNLWPVPVTNSPSSIGIKTFTVPGTSSVKLSVVSGDVSTIMLRVASRFHAEVQPLQAAQCGAYAWRANVNNPSVWSNHASGTAIDLNWNLHPNGRRNTFTAAQVSSIRSILSECRGVIRWGGDYTGTVDEMHFEVNRTRYDPLVAQVAADLRAASGLQRGFARSAVPESQEPEVEETVPGGPGTAEGVHPD